MGEWQKERVADCLVPLDLPTAGKVLARDYRTEGRYPVVDQGQLLIGGWTDEEASVIASDLPVVVFGDHTRALKYVDFPFVRGADGTQVLKPKPEIDPRFFYYALRSVDLPSRGYNRHFKALKEAEIALPSPTEQCEIANVLKLVDDLIDLQDEALRTAGETKKAAMRTLFTRGLRGEAQKQTEIGPIPVSWTPRAIPELCEIRSGGTPRKAAQEYWNGDIPWVSGKDLKASSLDDAVDHITREGAEAGSTIAPAGTVFLLVRGMGLAKDLPVSVISRPMAFNQDVKALVSRGEFSGRFLRSAIYFGKERLLSQIVPSAHGTMTLNLNDIEKFKVPCPSDFHEAGEIESILDTIDRKIDLHRRKRAVLDALFKALLHKLMTGEIRVADLDLSALTAEPRAGLAA